MSGSAMDDDDDGAIEQHASYLSDIMRGVSANLPGCNLVLLVVPRTGPHAGQQLMVSNTNEAVLGAMVRVELARQEGRFHQAPAATQ